MPDYTFECEKCSKQTMLFFTMSEYDKQHKKVKTSKGIILAEVN